MYVPDGIVATVAADVEIVNEFAPLKIKDELLGSVNVVVPVAAVIVTPLTVVKTPVLAVAEPIGVFWMLNASNPTLLVHLPVDLTQFNVLSVVPFKVMPPLFAVSSVAPPAVNVIVPAVA